MCLTDPSQIHLGRQIDTVGRHIDIRGRNISRQFSAIRQILSHLQCKSKISRARRTAHVPGIFDNAIVATDIRHGGRDSIG